MPDSPLAASPYEVLGVPATVSDEELRRAYRRRARQTHPDTGGAAREFDAVQRAWELIGTAEARAAYDRGIRPIADEERTWAPAAPARGEGTRPAARSHGHPGGWYREEFLSLLQEWAGRGVEVPDPYDPQLLARAPRELRHLLAEAVAEEDTARALAALGIGFTVWHDVRTDADVSHGLDASPQGAGGKLAAYARETGADAIGLDETVDPAWAHAMLPPDLPVQGNLDPLALIAGGDTLDRAVGGILEAFSKRPHIFNLGHGILPDTPIAHVERLLARVRRV